METNRYFTKWLSPGWGNNVRAAMAGLGCIGLTSTWDSGGTHGAPTHDLLC